MRRAGRRGLSHVTIGVIGIVLVVVVTYLGFTKSIPFRSHYEVKAVFHTSNNLRTNSKVRVAGVDIGKVTKVEHFRKGGESAIVTMRLQKNGLPLHKDARFAIRPRIFLEGNFFVDVQPGTPSSPPIEDGDTFPINQTKTPVQFDQLLSSLKSDTRHDLQVLLKEYARALDGEGGKGFNRSIQWWKPAYKNSAIVNEATLGVTEHDLSEYVKQAGTVAAALDRNPEQLKSLITDFNQTAAAFAREQDSLEATVAELPRTLRAARPALAALNSSFPPVRRFARDFLPGVKSSGPTIRASRPFVRQLRLLVSRRELRGLVSDLRPTVPSLATLTNRSVPLQGQVRAASGCQNDVILPWSRETLNDPNFPATGPIYQENVKWLPGIAGESRSGDANGPWVDIMLYTPNFVYPTGVNSFIGTTTPIQGVNPPKPLDAKGGVRYSPMRPDVPCETQERPDLRTRIGTPPQQRRVAIDTPRERRAYAKAKDAAVKWLRRDLRRTGLDKKYRVTEKEITRAQVERLGKASGR